MRYTLGLLCFLLSFLLQGQLYSKELKPSVALIYSSLPPDSVLYAYDWVVVDPSVLTPSLVEEKFYLKKRGKLIAYFSLGEAEPYRSYFGKFKKRWFLGKNKVWNSYVVDLRNKECFNFLLRKAKELLSFYDGILLDTLDSYQIVLPEKDWKSYEKAEVKFIKALKKDFPEKIIVTNRGFPIYEEIKDFIDGMVVESLFKGLNEKLDYVDVSPEERKWLLKKITPISKEKPVVVIDYLPSSKEKERRELAKKIMHLGFIPWVTDKDLSDVGEGVYHLLKRKIILLYDKDTVPSKLPEDSDVHRLVQMPLEWLGYVPELLEIENFSPEILNSQVKGIVIWNVKSEEKKRKVLKMVRLAIKKGIKVFIVDLSVFSPSSLRFLGIKAVVNKAPSEIPKLSYADKSYGYEIKVFPYPTDIFIKPFNANYKPILVLKNSKGQEFVPVAVTSWGGYGYSGYLLKNLFNDSLWVFDPFYLFSEVFRRLPFAPDVTTESGRRILTVHVDGDGFSDRSLVGGGKYYSAEILRDKVFKVYKLPHTVSVIVGELDPKGLYPKKSKDLTKVAKTIFSLPNVEPASHTYSHPYNWIDLYQMSLGLKPTENRNLQYGYHLPIPGYKASIDKEISYSVDFINEKLLPRGKKVKVFLWSGDCAPPPPVVQKVYEKKLYNVNGGDTTINNDFPYLCRVSPMGINKGLFFQVYAPVQNEMLYTEKWKVKYGYSRVISTFKLTEKPRRLKPISIYYHFYSASYPESLKSLKEVYDWASSQETVPMFLSQYAQRVLEFRGGAILKSNEDNSLFFCSGGNLKTLRLEGIKGIPDLNRSVGVVGYRKINKELYLFLDNSRCRKLAFSDSPKNLFYLLDSNGIVENFERKRRKIRLTLRSETSPLVAVFKVNGSCSLKASKNLKVTVDISKGEWKVESREKRVTVEADCER